MFDHVTIRVSDRAASERFYSTVLLTLGFETMYSDARFAEWDDFSVTAANDDNPVTRGLHVGFGARSREQVDQFWRAGTEAGYRDDGAPGPRPPAPTAKGLVRGDHYAALLLDPDGNSAEAVHHGDIRPGRGNGVIDHLWIRVADVSAARDFYATLAEYTGYLLREDEPDFAHFLGAGGSFSLLGGTPTEHLHLAFPASDNATVDAFHRVAIEAGYRDNGAPGERPQYHPGYYGAYVLDPDANNIEVVNHNR